MSAGATPSDLMSATSALAARALAAIASPASFPALVTPSVTRAKSGAALTAPSPVTSIHRSLVTSIRRVSSASAGETPASADRNAIRIELERIIPSWPARAMTMRAPDADCEPASRLCGGGLER